MAEYKDNTGVQYSCNSFYSRGVDEANSKMGYNDLGDRANTAKVPQPMKAAKVDKQEPASAKFGY